MTKRAVQTGCSTPSWSMIDPLGDQIPQRLAARLRRPLPGPQAHRQLAPELAYGRHSGPPAWNARPAAVMILLYVHRGRWHVPLILRPAHMAEHASQISLPGGMTEPHESPPQCAAREFEEELGPPRGSLQTIGRLTGVYVFGSNFWVTPCVAVCGEKAPFQPNPSEVDRVLEIDVERLVDPQCRASHAIDQRGVSFLAPHLPWNGDRIWGATAIMLAEFGEVWNAVRHV